MGMEPLDDDRPHRFLVYLLLAIFVIAVLLMLRDCFHVGVMP